MMQKTNYLYHRKDNSIYIIASGRKNSKTTSLV